ncbi:hypothetical protein ILYODFUR_031853 [Ilyodon furcidens]|uniref:Uncharacterized protein n=1 Tax=Ilyodon furcidens TaxID=33524 RepID=A0ABV0UM24_9TELE
MNSFLSSVSLCCAVMDCPPVQGLPQVLTRGDIHSEQDNVGMEDPGCDLHENKDEQLFLLNVDGQHHHGDAGLKGRFLCEGFGCTKSALPLLCGFRTCTGRVYLGQNPKQTQTHDV